MNDPVRDNSVKRVCRHCGVPISGAPCVRERDGYCCEGCFLSTRKQRSVAEEATLRGMVELKCGTAHADMLRTGHARNAQSAHPLGSDQ